MPSRSFFYNIMHLRIATRRSPLALWQANHVREQLCQHWPELTIELVPMVTAGDRFLQDSLAKIGGKGLFVKELEEAIFDGRADFAVHSMKDVPSVFPEGLGLAAICKRDHALDAFISSRYPNLSALPMGARIGTSSARRQSQLLAHRPDLIIRPLRGNIHTRLEKLEQGAFDAIILARAGLDRMGLAHLVRETLSDTIMLPACGQGALGIECALDNTELLTLLAPLNDAITAQCVRCEREVNRRLGGNCQVPLAIYCQPQPQAQLYLRAKIATPDGSVVLSDASTGPDLDAMTLASNCAERLLAQGGGEWLAR